MSAQESQSGRAAKIVGRPSLTHLDKRHPTFAAVQSAPNGALVLSRRFKLPSCDPPRRGNALRLLRPTRGDGSGSNRWQSASDGASLDHEHPNNRYSFHPEAIENAPAQRESLVRVPLYQLCII